MSILHKRAVAAAVGAFALVTAPAVVDLPGTDAGAAFAKKGGNGGGNGGGKGRGGGGNKGGGGKKGGQSARAGGSGGGIGLNRDGHWNPKKGKKKVASTGGSRSKASAKTKTSRSSGGSTKVASAKKTKTAPVGSTAKRRTVAEVQEMTATSIAPVERPGKKPKGGQGALASELKGLNAAHASEQAFANASPNSRVGRIAAYRDAVLGASEADAALTEAEEALAAFDAEELEGPSADEIDMQIAELDALGELTPEEQELRASLVEAYDAAIIAEAERAAERDLLVQAVAEAETEAETSTQSIEELFLAASDGRTLSPEAMDEFHRLLGIQEEVASLEEEEEIVEEEEPLDASGDPVIVIEEPTDVSAPVPGDAVAPDPEL